MVLVLGKMPAGSNWWWKYGSMLKFRVTGKAVPAVNRSCATRCKVESQNASAETNGIAVFS